MQRRKLTYRRLGKDGKTNWQNFQRLIQAGIAEISEARQWIDGLLTDLDLARAPLDRQAYLDAQTARAMLPAAVTLVDAARAWKESNTRPETPLLADALDQYERAKESSGLRPTSIATMRTCNRALRTLGEIRVGDITPAALAAHMAALAYSPTSHERARHRWTTFFLWAQKMGWVSKLPTAAIVPAIQTAKAPGIITPDALAKLLRAAVAGYPAWVPYLAVAAFAGVRTAELLRLPTASIGPKYIEVGAEHAKVRHRRLVAIHPTLAAWLAAYPPPGPRLCPVDSQQGQSWYMAKISKAAGVKLPPNAMRHSFATYHLAAYQDAARTALMLGHRGTDMLWQHYRALATEEQGAAWFAQTPEIVCSNSAISS